MSEKAKEFRDALLTITPNLRAYAFSLSGAKDTADDLVQDTLLKAWEKQATLKDVEKLKAWTMTIMRNIFFAHCRRSKFTADHADEQIFDSLVSVALQEVSADLRDVSEILETMDETSRECMVLIFVNELSYEEAAAVTGCPVGTMKSRVHRARQELCEKLGLGQDRETADADALSRTQIGSLLKSKTMASPSRRVFV